MYRKVMVGFDGSPCADKALQEGMEMAQAGARLTVVTVLPRQAAGHGQSRAGLHDGMLSPAHKELSLAHALELQEQVQAQLARQEVEAALQLIDLSGESRGTVASALVAAAAESGVDLIILGTHGRSGLRRFLLGSVAESVSRLALCPTLLVRAADTSAFACLNPVELYGMWPEEEAARTVP